MEFFQRMEEVLVYISKVESVRRLVAVYMEIFCRGDCWVGSVDGVEFGLVVGGEIGY